MIFFSIQLTVSSLLLLIGRGDALVPPEALVHTGVAALAGSAGAIAAYPIDYVKSQLQTEEGRAKYKNGIEAATDIIRSSPVGPFALYRGVWVNILGIAPEKTIKLTVNDYARLALTAHYGGQLPIAGEMLCGGIAGMSQVVVTNPLEVIKVKVQTSKMSVKEAVSQIKGFSDLYRGAEACVARDVSFSAILFPLYAHLKPFLLATLSSDGSLAFVSNIIAGSIAAAPAAFLATPMDLVKTRMQQSRKQYGLPSSDNNDSSSIAITNRNNNKVPFVLGTAYYRESKELSFTETIIGIINNEGPDVLFSGSIERVARSIPQFGITLAVFDYLTNLAASVGFLPSAV